MSLRQKQEEVLEWSTRNFGEVPNTQIPVRISSFLGMVEEMGEMAHAILKMSEGIRGSTAVHEAKMKDAIGDIIVFLLDFCGRNGLDAQNILHVVWERVKRRDFNADKMYGGDTFA